MWRWIVVRVVVDVIKLRGRSTDIWGEFCNCYVADRERVLARQRAMLDPMSAEGQRLIAEQIQRENIDFSHQFALEHMPEAYIPVTMLYINMKINGEPVKAFVDSGCLWSSFSPFSLEQLYNDNSCILNLVKYVCWTGKYERFPSLLEGFQKGNWGPRGGTETFFNSDEIRPFPSCRFLY